MVGETVWAVTSQDAGKSDLEKKLFIKQANNSPRKKIIAKRFITRLLPQVRMNYHHIAGGDNSTLKYFDTLVPFQTE